jgi:hypothetical protein
MDGVDWIHLANGRDQPGAGIIKNEMKRNILGIHGGDYEE